MKKKMLLLIASGFILPINISAICFKYLTGPTDVRLILIEADATKIGSNLPSTKIHSIVIGKGHKFYSKIADPDILKSNTTYITVKEYNHNPILLNTTLIKGVALDSNAAYDVTIDNNKKVSFTKVYDSCKDKTYSANDYKTAIIQGSYEVNHSYS